MFIGHFAVGLAARSVAPRVSLGTLFIAVQFQDLLWPLFLLAGIEHVRISPGITAATPLDFYDYPITHSLLGAAVLATLLGGVYWTIKRHVTSALVIAAAALSHWVLDFITHRPDLPLTYGGETRVGLGLWNSVAASVGVEAAMFTAGIFLYLRGTKAINATGRYGFIVLAVMLAGFYAAGVAAPPPPGPFEIAVAGNLMWLFVLLGYWVDRNRESTVPQNPGR